MSRHTPALAVPALAALAAIATLTACSGSDGAQASGPASSTPPSTITTTPKVSVTTETTTPPATSRAAGSTGAQTAAGSAGSAGSRCAESQLRASVMAQNVPGTGRYVVRLYFANISKTTCTITGYPGAAIVDSSGKQVQQAKRVVGGVIGGTIERPATIPVKPGANVFAYLEGQSTRERGAAQAGCEGPKFPRILVTPPNTDTPVPFTIGWPQCYAFNVHPVRSH